MLVSGLRIGNELNASQIAIKNYPKLVMDQVLGEYDAKDERMVEYLKAVKMLAKRFEVFTIEHVA